MSAPTHPARSPLDARALGMAALLLIPLFFPRLAPPEGRWWETGWDALHFPGFILITWVLIRLAAIITTRDGLRVGLAVFSAMGIAGGSELAHDFLGRSSSWGDFRVDTIGIACGAAGWYLLRRGGAMGLAVFALLVLSIAGWLLSPAWGGWLARSRLAERFPDIGCFDDYGSRHVWQAQHHASVKPDLDAARLTVRIEPGMFGGVTCWPAHENWSGRRELRLSIDNPGPPFLLGVRIDDPASSSREHDSRFNGQFSVATGSNDLRLPLAEVAAGTRGRAPLDVAKIRRLILFTLREESPREFTIRSARVE